MFTSDDEFFDALAARLAPFMAEHLNWDQGSEFSAEDVPPPDGPSDADPWGSDTNTRQTSQGRSQGRSSSSRATQGRGSGQGNARGSARGSARGGQRSERAQNRSQSRSNPGADVPDSGEYDGPNGQVWEFGLSEAPSCAHRMPGAYVSGQKRDGSDWHAWACPIGFTDQWKDKCDLWEFTR